MNAYEKKVRNLPWNKDIATGEDNKLLNPILLTCHGTDSEIADKICVTGFAALSALDDGYYGRGIYFSTYALYCYPYFGTRKLPSLILSWLVPGHYYPVIEPHNSSKPTKSLLGAAVQAGYNSHYVLTNREGLIWKEKDGHPYDEIVLNQESQVCVGFKLGIDKTSLKEVQANFMRETGWDRAKEEI